MPFFDGGQTIFEYVLYNFPIWITIIIYIIYPLLLVAGILSIVFKAYQRKRDRKPPLLEFDEYLPRFLNQHQYDEDHYEKAPILPGYMKRVYKIGRFFAKHGYTGMSMTYMAFLLANFSLYFYLLGGPFILLGGFFVFLSGYCDNLDGAVANIGGTKSVRGAFFDNILDVVSNLFMVVGPLVTFMLSPLLFQNVSLWGFDVSSPLIVMSGILVLLTLVGAIVQPILMLGRARLSERGVKKLPGSFMERPIFITLFMFLGILVGVYAIFLYIPLPWFVNYFFKSAYLYTFAIAMSLLFILSSIAVPQYMLYGMRYLPKQDE